MFPTDFEARIMDIRERRGAGSTRQWLGILLLCGLALASFEPLPTFSKYVASFSHSFTLSTSRFYLSPQLETNVITIDPAVDDGFSPGNDFTVDNYNGSKITSADVTYTITLEEDAATPLFDLYTDDGAGGKVLCQDNMIGGSLSGGSATTDDYTLFFKLKDSSAPAGNYPVNIKLTSSEPYIRTYSFPVNIAFESSMILIPDTDIYRPNVPIPEDPEDPDEPVADKIMVFKDNEYVWLGLKDLLAQPLVIDEVVVDLGRPDLVGGSLYIPESVGDIQVGADQTINWDVAGNIVMEPDIIINGNVRVNMLSHNGDIIINQTTISGPQTQPYIVNIEAEEGKINAIGTVIESKSDGAGIINLAAKDDINISAAEVTSQGSLGVNIHSAEGNINAEKAEIISTNGASNATVKISSGGQINLDDATVESSSSSNPPTPALLIESTGMGISARNAHFTSTSPGKLLEIRGQEFLDLDQAVISSQGAITISSAANITAKSVSMANSGWNNKIEITSSSGQIDLSSGTGDGMPVTNIASGDNVHIKAHKDIYIVAAKISASIGWAKELRFESTGSGRRLWVANAILAGKSIIAQNLQVEGTPDPASGNIVPEG